jgi:hypothetical protein
MEINIMDKYGGKIGYINRLNDILDKYGSKAGEMRSNGILTSMGAKLPK